MSVYSLLLIIVFSISLFSAVLIIAACVTSSRAQQFVARKSSVPMLYIGCTRVLHCQFEGYKHKRPELVSGPNVQNWRKHL